MKSAAVSILSMYLKAGQQFVSETVDRVCGVIGRSCVVLFLEIFYRNHALYMVEDPFS